VIVLYSFADRWFRRIWRVPLDCFVVKYWRIKLEVKKSNELAWLKSNLAVNLQYSRTPHTNNICPQTLVCHAFKLYSYLALTHQEWSGYPWERGSRVPFRLTSLKWILSIHLKSQTQFSATICSCTTTVLGLRIFAKRLVYSKGWGYGSHVSRFFAYARSYALEHYEDLADIKCAIVHTNVLQPEVSVFISQN
jgi:hypothetical protein